jgi:glutathione-regulated potassium-efflux system ancillary protein KefG
MPSSILIQFAHPAFKKSRINRALLAAITGIEKVTINDLYEEYPDFDIDVRREQKLLLDHDIIVFQHPLFWYSTPALLKQWEDLVLEYGFAYGEAGTKLAGKRVLTATTAGGPENAYQRGGYNYFQIREFLAPIEQTVRLCAMIYLPPFIVFGTLGIKNESEAQAYAKRYRELIMALRDDQIETKNLQSITYLNEWIPGSPFAADGAPIEQG